MAKGAEARGLRFAAVKVISDEVGFAMPPMDRFIATDGSFRERSFALYAASRPFIWPDVLRLAQNSAKAARRFERACCRAQYAVTGTGKSC